MFDAIFGRSDAQGASSVPWNKLTQLQQIEEILEESKEIPVLIFKHSFSCGTSAMMLDRMQRKWDSEEMPSLKTYFLDLLSHRDISNQIAETFGVRHQSPQILIINKGESIYDNSHMGISYTEVKSIISDLEAA